MRRTRNRPSTRNRLLTPGRPLKMSDLVPGTIRELEELQRVNEREIAAAIHNPDRRGELVLERNRIEQRIRNLQGSISH